MEDKILKCKENYLKVKEKEIATMLIELECLKEIQYKVFNEHVVDVVVEYKYGLIINREYLTGK